MFGAKALVAVLAAALLIPAAGATPGDGNGNGKGGHGPPASVGVGSGAAESSEPPPQAARGQASERTTRSERPSGKRLGRPLEMTLRPE